MRSTAAPLTSVYVNLDQNPFPLRLSEILVGAIIVHNTGTLATYTQFHQVIPGIGEKPLFALPSLAGGVSIIGMEFLQGGIGAASMWIVNSAQFNFYVPANPGTNTAVQLMVR